MTVMNLTKKLHELMTGDQVAEDVYKENMLLVKAGTSIDAGIKQKLKKWNILTVPVVVDIPRVEHKPRVLAKDEGIRQLFYTLLQQVVSEIRYGYALHSEKDIHWLESVFVSCMSDTFVYNELMALKEWDTDSFLHTIDVFLLGSLLSKKTGRSYDDHLLFAKGCLLHDIGKSRIPQTILQKRGTLSPDEFEAVKNHTIWGYEKVKAAKKPDSIAMLAKSHHEKLDGSGYPEGLKAKDIKQEVRMLTVVDIYSALTMKRSYRSPYDITQALKLLFDDRQKIDHHYLVEFMDMLCIYPPHSIVELSDRTKAEVLYVSERMPYMPILKRLDNLQMMELPRNLSLKISRFIFK